MRTIKLCLVLITIYWVISAGSDSPEWIIEDAFEKELLLINDISAITPEEVKTAIENYNKGQIKVAAEIFQKLRMLNLPDQRLDFTAFALGECYRDLGIQQKALEQYWFVLKKFPDSDKTAASLFRILEYSIKNNNALLTDSITSVFQTGYRKHSLYYSVLYTAAKSYYEQKRFGESIQLLLQIQKNSSLYHRACFLTALSYIHLDEQQKSLSLLEGVWKNSNDLDLSAEAAIVMGDIYYSNKNIVNAISFYNSVPMKTYRYQFALIKIARANLDLNRLEAAERVGSRFLRKFPESIYCFEMASIMEQVYKKSGKENEAERMSKVIHSYIVGNRLYFEIYQEIDRLTDIVKGWQLVEYAAIRKQNKDLISHAQENIRKAKDLESRFRQLLTDADTYERNMKSTGAPLISHLAERRYLNILKRRNSSLQDSIEYMKSELVLKEKQFNDSNTDKNLKNIIDSISLVVNELEREKTENNDEYSLVIKECLVGEKGSNQLDGEIQAKFIDWSFNKYQKKKENLKKLSEQISAFKNKRNKSLKQTAALDSKTFNPDSAEKKREELIADIRDDRSRLTMDMETILEVYPRNRYNSQIYFRLSELYFDAAGDEFENKLHEYDTRMANGGDTTDLQFPEYNLDRVISTYQRIQDLYPEDGIADDACFYKALALQKTGNDSLANQALRELIEKYQDSEFYVEANMSIGRYYFDHPRAENDQGYKFAEDAFRKVLHYKEHPQYIQALYHLGWCYYMQDQFDDAISVFKILVEKGNLDFDPSLSEDKQVTNPLLRDEAIDYIAISFDEEGLVDDANNFLQLIGNQDYSAIVLKRIGELREEDLDYVNAVKVYRKLLSEYPLSTVAADAMVRVISIYESQSNVDSSIAERSKFYHMFSNGSQWQKRNLMLDSGLVKRVDSMAISMGLYLADESFRKAEGSGDIKDYQKAAENYHMVTSRYSQSTKSADACWNLAVILEKKLDNRSQAFAQYISFCRNQIYDEARREQAALNALALGQSILPSDTVLNGEKLGFGAQMVLDASENYCKLFPNGKSHSQVLLGLGAVYFNRKMFHEALKQYEMITGKGVADSSYFESLLLCGQCHFGLEQYDRASEIFEKIWKECNDEQKKAYAIKLLLQSDFLHAKSLFNSGEYQKSALRFRSIEDRYPGSSFSDIALFNTAGAYEKLELWGDACNNYYDLVNKYPESKLAPNALFNAAADFEKSEKYNRAAEAYELLSSRYPESENAKDALFNLGFCYEKLGEMDKVAQVNELYSTRYPGEKDVESLLLRSADFYAKTNQYDKAITVYRNFVNRYSRSARSIEALYMTGKCYLDQKDFINAAYSFDQVESQNMNLLRNGFEGNNYYAAEAAYQIALLKRDQFMAVKIVLPEEQIKSALKSKSELLQEAAKAYQRVVQYHSEKMFEAAYRIGELYQEFSEACRTQERPRVDPINSAILEKDILNLSSQLMQKAFLPYLNAMHLADEFDSLSQDQRFWISKSRNNLVYCFSKSGEYLAATIEVMKKAPIPDEIRDKPLHLYQYQKKLYETLAPIKDQVMKYYWNVLKQVDSMKISDSVSAGFKGEFCRINYLTGSDYDQLSIEILKNTQNFPKNLSQEEKEELLFQLEDIVFELQDKAILSYEGAIARLQEKGFIGDLWYSKIWENLARLSPDKYGKSFYKSVALVSDEDWVMREDSVQKWNSKDLPRDGWVGAYMLKADPVVMAGERCRFMWGKEQWNKVYSWRHLFLDGEPGNASVYVSSTGKYRLYINGVLTMNDTISNSQKIGTVDSATGIVALVTGGDNIIALEAEQGDSSKGIAVLFTALVDTTKRFESALKLPVAVKVKEIPAVNDSTGRVHERSTSIAELRSKKAIKKVIDEYRAREQIALDGIKKERMEIQKLHVKIEEINIKIRELRKSSESIKQK
ncbi:MAG TPA: tetratricopeptide repeat protein [Chitinispirillaceae bacterium]|nr:tetratricopeptide repeat protein [Chitinispirillaceae bacterium]